MGNRLVAWTLLGRTARLSPGLSLNEQSAEGHAVCSASFLAYHGTAAGSIRGLAQRKQVVAMQNSGNNSEDRAQVESRTNKLAWEYVRADEPVFYANAVAAYIDEELHLHNDLELNFLPAGKITYLFGGHLFDLPEGRLVAFYGRTPHRVVHAPGSPMVYVTQVPAGWLLDWDLPHEFVERFLGGTLFIEQDPSKGALDQALMDAWAKDFTNGAGDPHQSAMLEIRARVYRFSQTFLGGGQVHEVLGAPTSKRWRRVEKVAHYIAQNYTDPITIQEIADAVGVVPNYLMQIFRKSCGITIHDYLTSFRIARAQHLLMTTDATVLDIAYEAGFGSASRFYAVFRKHCGMSPKDYRAQTRRH